ncbi:MAG: response regulator, partial [Candidatus Riflebacteria bacterium]
MVSGQKSKDLTGEKISVLLVDDSRIFRSFIEDHFRNDAFFEIIGSTWNGSKALEFLEKRIPDIIVLDVEMPELTGLETLGKINQIKALKGIAPNDIGVIMLSGQSSECTDNSMQALELGAFDVISKPPGYEDRFQIKAFLKDLNEKLLAFAARKRPELLPEKVRLATVNRSFEKSNIR